MGEKMRLEGRVSSEAEQNYNSYFKQITVILILSQEFLTQSNV